MTADTAFALERFAWEGPDRLALSGWFSGPAPGPAASPVLVLHGNECARRLSVDPYGEESLPADGGHWSVTFAWDEPPEAFDAAELELNGLVVPLPGPSPQSRARGEQVLAPRERSGGDPAAARDRLKLQGELLAAQEELAEVRAALERATEELSRARQDLEDERRRHGSDAERYRAGLAQVHAAAEQTVAEARAGIDAEHDRAGQLARRLADLQAPVAKAREDTSLLLGLLATIERTFDEE
jgi:hypothetical protein